jgi:hypothetical protein
MRAQLRRQVAHSQIDCFDSVAWRFQCLSSTAIEIAVDLAYMIDSPRTAMAGSARFIGECRFLGSTVTRRSLRIRETGDFAGKIAASLLRSLQHRCTARNRNMVASEFRRCLIRIAKPACPQPRPQFDCDQRMQARVFVMSFPHEPRAES